MENKIIILVGKSAVGKGAIENSLVNTPTLEASTTVFQKTVVEEQPIVEEAAPVEETPTEIPVVEEYDTKPAEELLTKGYVEFNEENIKHYFDGFVFAGRNGLYYESLNKTVIEKQDYEPSYSASDYIYALNNGGLKEEKFIGRQFSVLHNEIDFGTINISCKSSM